MTAPLAVGTEVTAFNARAYVLEVIWGLERGWGNEFYYLLRFTGNRQFKPHWVRSSELTMQDERQTL